MASTAPDIVMREEVDAPDSPVGGEVEVADADGTIEPGTDRQADDDETPSNAVPGEDRAADAELSIDPESDREDEDDDTPSPDVLDANDGSTEGRTSEAADRDDDDDDEDEDQSGEESKPKFHVRQHVYAKDDETGILYEAIVRRTMYGPKTKQLNILLVNPEDPTDTDDEDDEDPELCWHYFVHYQGWNVKWDRWVEEDSLYEDSEGAKKLAAKLKAELRQIIKMSKIGGKRGEVEIATVRRRMKQLEEERREEERKEELRRQGLLPPEEEETEINKKEEGKGNDPEMKEALAPEENANNEKGGESSNVQDEQSKRGPKKKLMTKALLEKERKLRKRDLEGRRKQVHAEKLILPFTLKKVLVEEWEVVSLCGMVPCLPSPVTIKDALDRYLESKLEVLRPQVEESQEGAGGGNRDDGGITEQMASVTCATMAEEKKEENSAEESGDIDACNANEERRRQEQEWREMVEGIAQFFDEALPVHLLYKNEMPQHKLVMKSDDLSLQGKRRCELYGCEYLLRLFVQFPAILSESDVPEADARKILSKIGDLVRYLQKHQGEIFRQAHRKPKGKEVMPPEKLRPRIKKDEVNAGGVEEADAGDNVESEEKKEGKREKRRKTRTRDFEGVSSA